jgi:hypothetical protein
MLAMIVGWITTIGFWTHGSILLISHMRAISNHLHQHNHLIPMERELHQVEGTHLTPMDQEHHQVEHEKSLSTNVDPTLLGSITPHSSTIKRTWHFTSALTTPSKHS